MTQTPFFTPTASAISLQGTTLVIPAVSIGSVPQLAIDLLLHDASLKLTKVGRFDPAYCFPFVGPSDSGDDDLTTALEVFSNGTLTVIQQRSPVYKSSSAAYITALTHWISESSFAETLWLSSIDAAARTDEEFSTPILSFPPPGSSPSTLALSKLSSSYKTFNPPRDAFAPTAQEGKGSVPHIPGSLLTKRLLAHVASQDNLRDKLGALLYFAAEGDTREDAHHLATVVLHLLSSSHASAAESHRSFKEPPSWSALFGQPAESSLYG
ncbi:Proteasome assembly chaperone 2 [Kalmanozyma brasiliensis GHG001]|uniref:Proteasome assembly chaperone 2 n=1 Tax=Kalmanozyma brasiliensis (strain GHG001) TaxID=1365824 RepID=UPI001CE8BC11|nr:Proteasome assembly chaperone 2 [Kalmanozyma brasiliensis GHG001]EST08339.2 Proteasome assembly chaperone 2 [Kalmanozyma brasiliensis GHG001]